jgi:hypothetical protein
VLKAKLKAKTLSTRITKTLIKVRVHLVSTGRLIEAPFLNVFSRKPGGSAGLFLPRRRG